MANEMILVVDADKKSQKVLEVCFKKAGYRVVLADSVAQAMGYVEQTRPSLIVSETVLSDGDGLEFCADLKHNPKYKDIPFVFLTEDRSLPQKMRGFELGADDYLTKPIYIKEVTTRVELLLQKRAKQLMDADGSKDFEGDLADITMIDLLQKIEHEQSSGSVLVVRGTRQAIIYFRDGSLLDAVCGKLQGEDAIYRVMMWSEGHFVIRYHEHLRRVDHVEKTMEALLLEGIHRLDEWNGLVAELPSMARVYALNYQQVSGQVDEFPGEVEQVVRLFDGHRSLHDVVDDSPLEDIVTLHIIGKLLDDDMLNDVTPLDASAGRNTMLDARGLNAWLSSSGGLRDTNPGLPFSHADHDFEESEKSEMSRAVADEVDTVDLRRPVGSKTIQLYKQSTDELLKESTDESAAGGGHWKFHWDEGDLRELDDSVSDDDHAEEESITGRLPGSALGGDTSAEESSSQSSGHRVTDSLREVEARETIRREEEARRLAEQMRQIDSPAPSRSLQPTPVTVGATDATHESDTLSEDSTQRLYVQALFEEARAQEAARSRTKTPLSTPAQMVRANEVGGVDAQWDELDVAVRDQEASHDGEVGDQHSEPVIHAARDAVEAVKPVWVAEEVVIETKEGEAGAEFDGSTEHLAASSDEDEQEAEEPDVEEQDSRVMRSEQITVPLTPSGRAAEEDLVEKEEDEHVTEFEEPVAEDTFSDEASSIEEETKPEEIDEQDQRVASAFEKVEEFEAPLFESPDSFSTSLQSPREGEVIRANFDLKKSGLRNIRGAVPSGTEQSHDALAQGSAEADVSGEKLDSDVVGDKSGSVTAEAVQDSDSAQVALASTQQEANLQTSESSLAEDTSDVLEDSEDSKKAEDSPSKDALAVASSRVAENDEEDSFFSSSDDPLMDYDDTRAASTNWKLPVIIAGVAALIVVLTWSSMNPSGSKTVTQTESATDEQVVVAPVEPVESVEDKVAVVPEPVAEDEPLPMDESAGLDEEQALAKAVIDSESVEEAARELSEALGDGASLAADENEDVEPDENAEAPVEVAETVDEPAEAIEKIEEPGKNEVASKPKPPPTPAVSTFEGKVLELRGLIKRERIGDALKLARTLSAEAPTDRSVAFLHGQAALYERQNSEAIENLARAERLGMRTSALYLELGQAYQLAGQTAQAKKSYEAFLEIQPSGRSADDVRSILKNQF